MKQINYCFGHQVMNATQGLRFLLASSLALTLLFLQGCTTADFAQSISSERPVDVAKSGVLLVNINTHIYASDGWLFIRPTGEERPFRIDANGFDPLTEWDRVNGLKGRVFAMSLPPGDYEIHNWTLYAYGDNYGARFFKPASPPPSFPFTIRRGEVTYIGHFTVQARSYYRAPFDQIRSPWGGRPRFFGAFAKVVDNEAQDIQAFRKGYPSLRHLPIRTVVPAESFWKNVKAIATSY
ncbi:MAG: hypothetical protein WBD34_22690 [Burkholderiaceae bacterium]